MIEGVIADHVAGARNLARNFRLLGDEAPDQEEARLDLMPGQHLQQAKRLRIVGTVVVGQGKLTRAAARAQIGASVELRSRGVGSIARVAKGGGANKESEHCRNSNWLLVFGS